MALSPDVTELLVDPDLGAQEFIVRRRTGKWQGGRMIVAEDTTFTAIGIVQPPSSEELQFFPEGERRKGMVAIYTQAILHLTEGEDVADDVTWRGDEYKIVRVDRWDDYGYCVAYAQKR